MSAPPTPDGVDPVLKALRAAAGSSPHFREAVRQVGLWLIELAESAGQQAPAGAAAPQVDAPASPRPTAESELVHQPRPIRGPTEVIISPEVAAAALSRGLGAAQVSPRVHEPVPGVSEAPMVPPLGLDFALVRARCRLKVEACAFALKRDAHEAAGKSFAELEPEYRDLIGRAKHPPGPVDCFLWMAAPSKWKFAEPEKLFRIERCFANLHDAVALVQEHAEARGHGGWTPEALWLLAEAQSALRIAIMDSPWQRPDPDQAAAWVFVRDEARRLHMFMDRFLSMDAPADPAQHENLAFRISAARQALQSERQAVKARRNALGKVDYEARRLVDGDPDDRAAHLRTMEDAVGAFIRAGGDPAARELIAIVDPVRPLLDGLVGVESVLHRVRAASRPPGGEDPEQDEDDRPPGPELLRARELLHEKTMLFIGGEERPQHARRLEELLELREFRWRSHREHTSLGPLEAEIARADVDVVVLPIRWNGTETGPMIRSWCREYAKPCVTLKAGYNANQIAHAVLEQVSERLAAGTGGSGGVGSGAAVRTGTLGPWASGRAASG